MASQPVAVNSASRLAQMQMRFQMKQQEEREQRRMEMTEETSPVGDNTVDKTIGNGRVRQMFDERRRGAGIDRSNPLKPISTGSRDTSNPQKIQPEKLTNKATRRPLNGARTTAIRNSDEVRSSAMSNGSMQRGQRLNSHNNNSSTLPKEFSSLSLGTTDNDHNNDRNNNNYQSEAYKRARSSNSIKLNPILTKKATTPLKPRPTSRLAGGTTVSGKTSPRNVAANALQAQRSNAEKSPPSGRTTATVNTPSNRRTVPKMSLTSMGTKPAARQITPPAGMSTCRYCKRNFNDERLGKHETVCERMASKKRKIFDASKHRVKGTDAEKYLRKQPSRVNASTVRPSYISAAAATGLKVPENSALKRSNWRKKHEEFITAIRAAKKVQAHLARGGDIRDLPPPPPSENLDYIQCPHCLRRFNEAAADRHIPKCANMQHNKPRPNAPNRRK